MEDRRIRKTKKAFYNVLINLLKEKELKDISVQQLCELADSHRSTFYYHYNDIYDLYDEMESKVIEELSFVYHESESHDYLKVYEDIITYMLNNREVWVVLLNNSGNKNFKDKISKIQEEKYIDIWKYETGKKNFPDEFYLFVKSASSSFITLFTEWLTNYPNYPKEKFFNLLKDMDSTFDALIEKYL